MMAQKPLMLKDYLELDFGSESSSRSDFLWSPRRAITVRCLLEAEFRRGGDNDSGRRQNARSALSKSAALRKLSAVINAVKLLPFFSSSSSYSSGGGSGGFSKRLIRRGGFWKSKKARLREEPEKVRVLDIVQLLSSDERGSFGFRSPVVRSCSETTTASSCGSDFLPSSVSSSENLDDMAAVVAFGSEKDSSPPCTPKPAETVAGRHRPPPKCRMEDEEKEQLSPVSAMDFPYEEEDEDEEEEDEISGVASPSFNQAIANIERTKLQLLQKIRRFECLAELDTAHLESRFEDLSTSGDEQDTASDYESDGIREASPTAEARAWALLEELRHGTRTLGSFDKLLLDFFVQELRRSDDETVNLRRPRGPRRSEGPETSSGAQQREDSMLRAARDWMLGDVEERSGEATIKEMESSGRWRWHAEEEDGLGADLEEHVFGLLLDELVLDLRQL